MKTSIKLTGALLLSTAILATVETVNADSINDTHVTLTDDNHATDDNGVMWSNDGGTWFNSETGESGLIAPDPTPTPIPSQADPELQATPSTPIQGVPTPKQETPSPKYQTPSQPADQQAPVKTPDQPAEPKTPTPIKQATPTKTPSEPVKPAEPVTPATPKQETPTKVPTQIKDQAEPVTPKAPVVNAPEKPSKTPSKPLEQIIDTPIKTFPATTHESEPTNQAQDFGVTVIVDHENKTTFEKGFEPIITEPTVFPTTTIEVEQVTPIDLSGFQIELTPTTTHPEPVETVIIENNHHGDIIPSDGVPAPKPEKLEPAITNQGITPDTGDLLSILAEKPHQDKKDVKKDDDSERSKDVQKDSKAGATKEPAGEAPKTSGEPKKTELDRTVDKLVKQSAEVNTLPKTGENNTISKVLSVLGISLVATSGLLFAILKKKEGQNENDR